MDRSLWEILSWKPNTSKEHPSTYKPFPFSAAITTPVEGRSFPLKCKRLRDCMASQVGQLLVPIWTFIAPRSRLNIWAMELLNDLIHERHKNKFLSIHRFQYPALVVPKKKEKKTQFNWDVCFVYLVLVPDLILLLLTGIFYTPLHHSYTSGNNTSWYTHTHASKNTAATEVEIQPLIVL